MEAEVQRAECRVALYLLCNHLIDRRTLELVDGRRLIQVAEAECPHAELAGAAVTHAGGERDRRLMLRRRRDVCEAGVWHDRSAAHLWADDEQLVLVLLERS